MNRIEDGALVLLHYTLRDAGGEVLETTEGGQPLELLFGRGMVPSGLERGLRGLRAGDEATVVVMPQEGYGEREKARMVRLRRGDVPDAEVDVGTTLRRLSTDGTSETFVVTGFVGDWLCADGNHPYAGRELHYSIEILDVRPTGTPPARVGASGLRGLVGGDGRRR